MKLSKHILFVLTLLLCTSAMAQEAKFVDKFYRSQIFEKEIPSLLSTVNQRPTLGTCEQLANYYRYTNNFEEAAFWYERACAFEASCPNNYLFWGLMLKATQRYDLAKEKIRIWEKRDGRFEELAKDLISSCDSGMRWTSFPRSIAVAKSDLINSSSKDFGVVSYKTGLIFSSNRLTDNNTSVNYYRLFFADGASNNKDGYTILPLSKEINNKYNNGPASFARNGSEIWFCRTNYKNGMFSDRQFNTVQLYFCLSQNSDWFQAQPFKYNSEKYSIAFPSISEDGKALYFASDMLGGYGGMDIYVSYKSDTGWTKPANLGPGINTVLDEISPFWNESNSTLYFSSQGHIGMGGFDIFSSKKVSGRWSRPNNLRAPINSSKDDYAFSLVSNTKGYFTSNRDRNSKNDVNYMFDFSRSTFSNAELPAQELFLEVEPFAFENGKSAFLKSYTINFTNLTTGQIVNFNYNKSQGSQVYIINSKDKYNIDISCEGYFSFNRNFEGSEILTMNDVKIKNSNYTWSPTLVPLQVGRTVVMNNIFFDLNSATLSKDAKKELDKLVSLMMQNPSIKVELSSHTDNRGTPEYNLLLSNQRAQSCTDYIVERGISKERILAKGYGETKPVNTCFYCTEEDYAVNRRTEFTILDIVN
jgi:outer membrane protein OmpA-like peptidoglycan-associated protein/tetratricopeptide (TPR) repeat protein